MRIEGLVGVLVTSVPCEFTVLPPSLSCSLSTQIYVLQGVENSTVENQRSTKQDLLFTKLLVLQFHCVFSILGVWVGVRGMRIGAMILIFYIRSRSLLTVICLES